MCSCYFYAKIPTSCCLLPNHALDSSLPGPSGFSTDKIMGWSYLKLNISHQLRFGKIFKKKT